ncbi:restriction endonuclease [Gottfriedia sp. NPDC057991]|uniref:restriction endonuclease n=1 Tax=Gottfriedia sp. NPDC057991 TaxID=3346298 RepID=UPI0036D7B6A4
MGRRRRKKSSNLTLAEGIFLVVILAYLFFKKVVQLISDWIQSVRDTIENFHAFDWLLIIIFLFSLIVTIIQIRHRYLQKKIKQAEVKRTEVITNSRKRVSRASNYEELIKLDPYEFEKFVADIFTVKGFDAIVTSKSRDGGKDIILSKENKKYIVECKRYNKKQKISRTAIQKFHSAIIDTGAEYGYFVTTSFFTKDAIEYVSNKPIVLIDLHSLSDLIEEVKHIS